MLTVSDIVGLFRKFPPHETPLVRTSKSKRARSRHASRALLLTQTTAEAARLRARIGMDKECEGIDLYVRETGRAVDMRNDTTISMTLDLGGGVSMQVMGRPDAVCVDRNTVIEHKYRVHGLLGYVPLHERVQCHMYMKLIGCQHSQLVETFGKQIRIHDIFFDDDLWRDITDRVTRNLLKSDFTR